MSQKSYLKSKLGFHLRKMRKLEELCTPASQAVVNPDWLRHQKEAEDAVWYLGAEVTDHQRNLVFRWI